MFSAFLITALMMVLSLGWFVVMIPFLLLLSTPILAVVSYFYYSLTSELRRILPTNPLIQKIHVAEDGNPIVNLALLFPDLRMQKENKFSSRHIRARKKIGEMLMLAERSLDFDYHLLLMNGYKSKIINSELQDYTGYETGGAIDVTLVNEDGNELDLGEKVPTQLNWYGGTSTQKISLQARKNRRVLFDALEQAGFVNNPLQWWHWSYGDQYWCARTRSKNALYSEQI